MLQGNTHVKQNQAVFKMPEL